MIPVTALVCAIPHPVAFAAVVDFSALPAKVAAPKAERDRVAAEAGMKKADDDLAAAREKWEAARGPHEHAHRRATAAMSAAESARSELFRTYPDNALIARRAEVLAEIAAAEIAHKAAVETHTRFVTQADSLMGEGKNLGVSHDEAIAEARAKLPRLHAAVQEAEREVARLIALRDEVEEQMRQVQ